MSKNVAYVVVKSGGKVFRRIEHKGCSIILLIVGVPFLRAHRENARNFYGSLLDFPQPS